MPTPPPPFRSVGDFIRSQRELMSLSMRQLAEMAQVSNPYLSQIERGVYKPSAQVLKGIADALDMSAETLYREAGLLDDSVERPAMSVEDAIQVDPRLTQEGKLALIQVYQGALIAAQPAPERRAQRPAATASGPPVRRAARKPAAASQRAKPTRAKPTRKTTTRKTPTRQTRDRRRRRSPRSASRRAFFPRAFDDVSLFAVAVALAQELFVLPRP